MADYLFLTLTLAPFVTPLIVLAAALALALRTRNRDRNRNREPRSGWRLPDAGSCALVTVMAAAATLGTYAYGVMSGFYILDPDQMCAAAGAAGDHVVTRMTLPVSARCVTEAGEGTELVPSWVNPAVFAGLTLSVLAPVAAMTSAIRRRAGRSADAPSGPSAFLTIRRRAQ